jgi:phosphopantetheine--protein transferase-like protein
VSRGEQRLEPAQVGRGSISLWLAVLAETEAPQVVARARALVSEEELERASRFDHESDRRRSLLSAAVLRLALSRHAAVLPAEWRIQRTPAGRPLVATPEGKHLGISLAHSKSLVAIAVGNGVEVGIDAESEVPVAPDLTQIARRALAPSEWAEYEALPHIRRWERFLVLWTLKEALLKARGTGLEVDPRCVEFSLVAEDVVVSRQSAPPPTLRVARLLGDIVAVAALGVDTTSITQCRRIHDASGAESPVQATWLVSSPTVQT